jgi:hypothetical protein
VFDTTAMAPIQIADIQLSDSPGWIAFDLGAKYVFPSTGDVIDRRTRSIVATLRDETGAQVPSEKILEIDFDHGQPLQGAVGSRANPVEDGEPVEADIEAGAAGKENGAARSPAKTNRQSPTMVARSPRSTPPNTLPAPRSSDRS